MSRSEPFLLDIKPLPVQITLHLSVRSRHANLIHSHKLTITLLDFAAQFRVVSAMASVSRVLLLLAVTAAMACLAVARPMEDSAECGHQAYDAVCLFNMCCSKDGMCGNKDECGAGCQSGPCKKVEAQTAECGKQAHDAECWPRSQCCNAEGMCGTGDDFCGNGCQGGSCYRSPFNLE